MGGNCQLRLSGDSNEIASFYFILFYFSETSFQLASGNSKMFFPKQCGNTWGSYGSGKKRGWLDRGGGRVAHRFHRYFRGFVLACSFRL